MLKYGIYETGSGDYIDSLVEKEIACETEGMKQEDLYRFITKLIAADIYNSDNYIYSFAYVELKDNYNDFKLNESFHYDELQNLLKMYDDYYDAICIYAIHSHKRE